MSGKRKRPHDDGQPPRAKKPKALKPEGGASGKGSNDDSKQAPESGVKEAISQMDGRLLSDYIAQKAKHFEKHITTIELEDKLVSESAWRDTTSWNRQRDLDSLPDYLEHFSAGSRSGKGLAWAPAQKATPHTIVLAAAAMRAADLSRILRKFKAENATIAKLFAKHIKLKEAEEFVKSSRIGIAVGTPARVLALVKGDILSVTALERIVIDGSHIDQKQRTIFDMRETLMPLMELLSISSLKQRYSTSSRDKVDLLVY